MPTVVVRWKMSCSSYIRHSADSNRNFKQVKTHQTPPNHHWFFSRFTPPNAYFDIQLTQRRTHSIVSYRSSCCICCSSHMTVLWAIFTSDHFYFLGTGMYVLHRFTYVVELWTIESKRLLLSGRMEKYHPRKKKTLLTYIMQRDKIEVIILVFDYSVAGQSFFQRKKNSNPRR